MIGRYIFLVLLSLLMVFTLSTTHMIMHEQAHEQVAYITGGSNCSIHLGIGAGYTECDDYGNNELQAWNEIIGYNMLVISTAIILGSLLIGLALYETRK